MRVFKEDEEDKTLEFMGGHFIGHTPEDEKISLYLGNAFDIKAEITKKKIKSLSKTVDEITYEVKVRNHKKSPVVVTVTDQCYPGRELLKSTHAHITEDMIVKFDVPVDKNAEAVLEYTMLHTKE